MRNSQRLGFGENAKKHFIKVNKCSELDFASHFAEAQIEFEERNKVLRWEIKTNLSKFGGTDIAIRKKYIPFIISPYSNQNLEQLKNSSDLKPRILDININNYNGTISIACDKTNKIEWYADEVLIKTKYNIGQRFRTKVCVENFLYNELYFILIGNFGKTISKKFILQKID
ncbi:MAG: hypothetical protein RR140_00015 [Clostridia bacterium]